MSAPNRSSLDSTSGFGGNRTARGLTFTGRWQAWRGPSAAGATLNQHGLQTINEAAVGFSNANFPSGFLSSGYDSSGYESHAAATSVSDFGYSPNTSTSGQHDETSPAAIAEPRSTILASPASTATSSSSTASASQASTGPHGASRFSTGTAAVSAAGVGVQRPASAAAASLRPSSAQQPRSGAGLPLGEGLEGTPEDSQEGALKLPGARVHISATGVAGVVLPAAPAGVGGALEAADAAPDYGDDDGDTTAAGTAAAASAAASQAPSSTASSPSSRLKPAKKYVGEAASDAAKPPAATCAVPTDDNHYSSSRNRSCCDCSWLRTNLQSMGWKLDPWVILLSLLVSCAALAAGAVQLATRARTPEQKSAIQQVGWEGRYQKWAGRVGTRSGVLVRFWSLVYAGSLR